MSKTKEPKPKMSKKKKITLISVFSGIGALVITASILLAIYIPVFLRPKFEEWLLFVDKSDGKWIEEYESADELFDFQYNETYGGFEVVKFRETDGINIVVPRKHTGDRNGSKVTANVVSIARDAIAYKGAQTANVVLPSTIVNIETLFDNSPNTQNYYVAYDNETYSSLNGVIFNADKTKLIRYPSMRQSKSYTIPNGVTTIGEYAFAYSQLCSSIKFSSSVKTIESYAFASAAHVMDPQSSDTEDVINKELKAIGDWQYLFSGGFESFDDFNNRLDNAFNSSFDAAQATIAAVSINITLNEGLTTIEDHAFFGCFAASIKIPNSVTSIGEDCFELKTTTDDDQPVVYSTVKALIFTPETKISTMGSFSTIMAFAETDSYVTPTLYKAKIINICKKIPTEYREQVHIYVTTEELLNSVKAGTDNLLDLGYLESKIEIQTAV